MARRQVRNIPASTKGKLEEALSLLRKSAEDLEHDNPKDAGCIASIASCIDFAFLRDDEDPPFEIRFKHGAIDVELLNGRNKVERFRRFTPNLVVVTWKPR